MAGRGVGNGVGVRGDIYLFSRSGWPELMDLDAISLATHVFFQMWRTRADPYTALGDGDVVYIGDPRSRRVTWEVRITDLLTDFHYTSRRHALTALRMAYGLYVEDLNDYHRERPARGWLLAWAPTVMRRVDIAVPAGINFGRNGYARLGDAERAAIGLPKPKTRSPLASPPPWYDASAAHTGVPRVVPRHIPLHVRRAVVARDGGQCVGCGTTRNLHVDHVLPYSHGGAATLENLQLVCARSNLAKGAGDPEGPLACARESG